jgi:hypothetical protein
MCKPTSWCAGGWCDLSGAVAGETIPYYRFNIRVAIRAMSGQKVKIAILREIGRF